jgi:small subunit ribosomal protein S12
MVTASQLSKGARQFKPYPLSRSHLAFDGAPQRKGVVYKIAVMTPRKPNSAKRTIAKVRLNFNGKRIFAKIPGLGEHFLQSHAVVLVRGHGPKDTPGVNYHLIRGLFDFERIEVFGRRNRRSKFGIKRFHKQL